MITSADIKERLTQRPFQPFRIVTSSGRHYDIVHPEFLMVGKRTLAVGIPSQPGEEDFDRIHVLSVLHVTALEDAAAPSEPS